MKKYCNPPISSHFSYIYGKMPCINFLSLNRALSFWCFMFNTGLYHFCIVNSCFCSVSAVLSSVRGEFYIVFFLVLGYRPWNAHRMEDVIIKIIDFENEINAEIDRLVDIKREITCLINSVPNQEEQTLLELRYLCFKTWEQIAVEMGYSLQNVYKLHSKALKNLPND